MVPVPSSVVDGDSHDEPHRLTTDDPLAGLSKWVAEGQVDAAAAERARQRWLERQASESATLSGVLLDLAERGNPVAIRSLGQANIRGHVVALGADFVVVREERLGDVFVPLRSLALVRSAPDAQPVVGARHVTIMVVLAEALVDMAAERALVRISTAGEEVRGELRGAGLDVVAVATDAARASLVHIATDAIDHVVLLSR